MSVSNQRRTDSAQDSREPNRTGASADRHVGSDLEGPKTPIVAILQHDEAITDLIAEAIESEGCEIVTAMAPEGANDHADALQLIASKKPDIVVFDVVQPFGDTAEGFKAFRRLADARGRRFVLTTTDREALQSRGLPGAVRLTDGDDVEKVADAVRAALTELESESA